MLGALTSVVMTYLGYQCGRVLVYYKNRTKEILVRWCAWGVLLGVIACGLCGGQADGGVIPINKNLW